jgi:hypothetical protein
MELITRRQLAVVFDRPPSLPEKQMGHEIALGFPIRQVAQRPRAQDNQDGEQEKSRIEPGEAIEEQPDKAEDRARSPLPTGITQRDHVAAQREEDRHTKTGGTGPRLHPDRQLGGGCHSRPYPIVIDDHEQSGKPAQACQRSDLRVSSRSQGTLPAGWFMAL